MGSLSLLQGIFPSQGSNPGLLHCRQILYQLSHRGSPLALGSITTNKASGGDGIPVELFQILKDDAVKAYLENSSVATGLERGSFHSNPRERQCQRMFELPHNCTHFNVSKVISQNSPSQAQQYVNRELPDVQVEFRKGRGTRGQMAKIHWIMEKAGEFQKSIYSCCIDYTETFDCVDHNKLWRIL